jgi:4-hydroxybenzoate polyprenyltransferase
MESSTSQTASQKESFVRTLLILGRVSNLPTVWSNCLAGWLIGGAGEWRVFFQLCIGASLLYIGGMFLNDACDEAFDRQHRGERPIPSGTISSRTVWMLSYVALGLGALVLILTGRALILPALGLMACIIFYDVIHKQTAYAPLVMAGCRFLLYLVAGAAAGSAGASPVLWAATAMALYIVGLSYVARRESTGTRINGWPLPLLVMPVLIAVIQGGHGTSAVVLWLLLLGWVLFALSPLRTREPGVVGVVVSRLLAGIVLVDMLAVPGASGAVLIAFALLFGSALLLQRIVPAT